MTKEQYQGLNNMFKQFPVSDTPILSFEKDKELIEKMSNKLAEKLMKDLSKYKSKQ